MPFYYDLKGEDAATRKRTAQGLLRLKDGLRSVPRRGVDDKLLLATWNIREFESGKGGIRGPEPLHYIAEIVNAFDLVAIQEVRDDLSSFDQLLEYLGGWWKFVLTDVTEGTVGNRERLAFLYDSRKVSFTGLASEMVLPPVKSKPALQISRTPYMVGFRAGWFKFQLCTVHILYGKPNASEPKRIEEIRKIARFLKGRSTKDESQATNIILLGDFNIFKTSDATAKALTSEGFVLPTALQKLPSNAQRNKHYDQIAFRTPTIADQLETYDAGVFDYYEYVYRTDDADVYEPQRKKSGKLAYSQWRTFQMSDHLPMWIELNIDYGQSYLNSLVDKRTARRRPAPPPAVRATEERRARLRNI